MEFSTEQRRWALTGAAALVVAAVLVAGWWLAQPRPGTGGGVAAGSGASDAPGAVGSGVAGNPGPVDRGAAGDPADVDPATGQAPIDRGPRLAKGAVRVDSYVVRGTQLLLNYTTGVPECYGEVAVAQVREGARRSVTVGLRSVPPEHPAEQCIDLAVTGTVAVDLSAPLGRRWVLDGGFEPAVPVREATRPHSELEVVPDTAEG